MNRRYRRLWRIIKQQTVVRLGYYSRPAFLVIGAQKAGTTALAHYLSRHPRIVMPPGKELHYFDRPCTDDDASYHSRFPLPYALPPDGVTFDATPRYIYHPDVPGRIKNYCPDIKMILLLRHPVDRAFSAWNVPHWHHRQQPFDALVRAEVEYFRLTGDAYAGKGVGDLVHRGLYYQQVQRYLHHFPREQLLIIDHRDLLTNRDTTLAAITDFLDLPAFDWSEQPLTEQNKGRYAEPIAPQTRTFLNDFYRPFNEKLYERLGVDYGWQ